MWTVVVVVLQVSDHTGDPGQGPTPAKLQYVWAYVGTYIQGVYKKKCDLRSEDVLKCLEASNQKSLEG